MDGFTAALFISLGVVFVAELGDKSQLMALTFASRFKFWPVVIGMSLAAAVTHAFSVVVGAGLGYSLPTGWITLVAALAFFGFAIWTLWDTPNDDDEAKQPATKWWKTPIIAVFLAFVLAEIGDKTMLATIVLASQNEPWGTWVGATLGMVGVNVLAIAAGAVIGKKLPEKVVRYGAAALFALFGLVLAWEGAATLLG